MATFKLTISSPDGNLYSGDVTKISMRGTEGDFAVMAGHIPFITAVKPGDCKVEFEDGTQRIGHTDGGLITVAKDGVTLLAGSFEWK